MMSTIRMIPISPKAAWITRAIITRISVCVAIIKVFSTLLRPKSPAPCARTTCEKENKKTANTPKTIAARKILFAFSLLSMGRKNKPKNNSPTRESVNSLIIKNYTHLYTILYTNIPNHTIFLSHVNPVRDWLKIKKLS